MRVDPSTGLVITQPVETPVMRKTRTGAATDGNGGGNDR